MMKSKKPRMANDPRKSNTGEKSAGSGDSNSFGDGIKSLDSPIEEGCTVIDTEYID
jgi:hypothetical protein